MGNFVADLMESYMYLTSGLDYDDIKFAIGTVNSKLEQQALTLFTKNFGSDDTHIVFSVPAVQRWEEMCGHQRAVEIAAYVIAYNMGTIKSADTSSIRLMEYTEMSEDTMANADAYAIAALGVSKRYIADILNDVIKSTYDTENLSLWIKATLETSIESRVDRAAVKKYVWEGKVPNLESQLNTWAELLVSTCVNCYNVAI